MSLVFFFLSKPLFSGLLQFSSSFAHGQNDSKYRGWAPLSSLLAATISCVISSREEFVDKNDVKE